jgi:NAD(P)-dependent dehydrogenase (short-subunit alcohol dehydrogenase family)
VVVTASTAGLRVGATQVFGYSASKAAVIHLTRNLAMELAPRHVLCNSISPGFFPSKLANGAIEMMGGAEKLAKAHPDGRLGRPEDFAAAVVFLCSRAGSHINAENLVIDGGKMWLNSKM